MSPEDRREFEQLKKTVKEQKAFIDGLSRFDKIPLQVQLAFDRKLGIREIGRITTSTKGATTENQAVDEGGLATYNVLKAPDGFLQVQLKGVTYNLPYYS